MDMTIIKLVFLPYISFTRALMVLYPLFLRYLTARKAVITAPMAQAVSYQPAERPTLKAFSAIPMVDAPPIARPAILEATTNIPFLPLYIRKASPSFFCLWDT